MINIDMRLDEINRRGFLKGASGAAMRSVVPGKEISNIIKIMVDDVGGVSTLSILSQLLSICGITLLHTISAVVQSPMSFEGCLDEFLNDDELSEFYNRIQEYAIKRDGKSTEEPFNYYMYDIVGDERLFDCDTVEDYIPIFQQVSKFIGRDLVFLKAMNIIKQNNMSPKVLFDEKLDNFLRDKWKDEVYYVKYPEQRKKKEVNAGNIAQVAKEASLPFNMVRLAGLISTVANKILGKSSDKNIPITPPTTIPDIPQLPPPENKDEITGLNDIKRMQDLAGIPKK